MEQVPFMAFLGAFGFGILNLVLGLASGRTPSVVFGAVFGVLMILPIALRPLAWRRFDLLDAALDARVESDRT